MLLRISIHRDLHTNYSVYNCAKCIVLLPVHGNTNWRFEVAKSICQHARLTLLGGR